MTNSGSHFYLSYFYLVPTTALITSICYNTCSIGLASNNILGRFVTVDTSGRSSSCLLIELIRVVCNLTRPYSWCIKPLDTNFWQIPSTILCSLGDKVPHTTFTFLYALIYLSLNVRNAGKLWYKDRPT